LRATRREYDRFSSAESVARKRGPSSAGGEGEGGVVSAGEGVVAAVGGTCCAADSAGSISCPPTAV